MKKIFDGCALVECDRFYDAIQFKLWENYGKKRIYINRDDGKKSYGYIDCNNGYELVVRDREDDYKVLVAKFFEEYEIA